MQSDLKQLVLSAIKASAPIAGIPIEGSKPMCIDGKRLKIWSKHVRINAVTISPTGQLCIEGKSSYNVSCSCKLNSITQVAARKVINRWAERKRATLLAHTSEKQSFRLLKYEDEPTGSIPVNCFMKEGEAKVLKFGIPVVIPEIPQLRFALVRFGNVADENITYSLTELNSGKSTGRGNTPNKAISDARLKFKTLSQENKNKIIATCEIK